MTHNGTALTTTEQCQGMVPGVTAGRPEAAFTTQLLAIRLDSPAFRQRRRLEPALGVAAYRERLRLMSSVTTSAIQA